MTSLDFPFNCPVCRDDDSEVVVTVTTFPGDSQIESELTAQSCACSLDDEKLADLFSTAAAWAVEPRFEGSFRC